MAREGQILLDGKRYDVVADEELPRGARAYTRDIRPSQPSDRGQIASAWWMLSGPVGLSREGADGRLGHDYSDNLETLYDELLTSSASANDLTLTTVDPPAGGATAALGGFVLGGGVSTAVEAALGAGTADATAGNLTHIDQQAAHLFFHRGPFSTQVSNAWAVVKTKAHAARVEGAVNWQGFGWVGLGANSPLQKRTGVTATGATYTSVSISGTDINAGELKRGNDRLWFVNDNTNQARYTPDAFVTAANPFSVGDDGRALNGIGTLGPFTIFGAEDGIFGFTDAAKPVVVQDLEEYISENNGAQHVEMWGWDYYITNLGLFAWTPNVVNPVGLEALKGFEGAIDGRPTAVGKFRDSVLVAYLTTGGDTYIVRGMFGPATDGTGEPLWFPFKKLTAAETHCISGVASPFSTNPNIIVGRGTNATRYVMGRRGRDIADANYVFSTGGGTWFGTTMMRLNGMHANLRHATFFTENLTPLNTWQLAVSCDGAAYRDVGGAVYTNGHQVVRPTSGSMPRDDVDFHYIKPRLTQVAGSSTAPPQIRGKLTLYWDERPDTITEVKVYVYLRDEQALDAIFALASHDRPSPIEISLPGRSELYYGFIGDVKQAVDVKADAQQAVALSIQLWSTD